MKSYKLTSPNMRGDTVKMIQRHLVENVFKESYHPGTIDGIFGESTAAATYRAKYAIGYPADKLIRTYGTTLDNFLTGKTKLPDDYRNRRLERKKLQTLVPLRTKALKEAAKYIGIKESPFGSNRVQFSVWYGIIGPWCAMLVTRCYNNAGSKIFKRGSRYSYVPYIVHDARRNLFGLFVVHSPEPGDLVAFDFTRDGQADHVGLFEKWINRENGEFTTIEGNTSVGNDSNGGEVMRRNRRVGSVQAFIRVSR